jgi:hypothetical protein
VRTAQIQQRLRGFLCINLLLGEESQMHAIAGKDQVAPSWRGHCIIHVRNRITRSSDEDGPLQAQRLAHVQMELWPTLATCFNSSRSRAVTI